MRFFLLIYVHLCTAMESNLLQFLLCLIVLLAFHSSGCETTAAVVAANISLVFHVVLV